MTERPVISLAGAYGATLVFIFLSFLVFPSCLPAASLPEAGKTEEDVLLRAMQEELSRSKAQIKMDGAAAPYYIEYRVTDVQEFTARAEFGAPVGESLVHARFLRAVVRVGDYKDDSYYGMGQGSVDFIGLDDDMLALRHQLWLLTDRAYKDAIESLAAKHAALEKFKVDQPVDDFAHAPAVHFIGPLAKLDSNAQTWRKTLMDATALYRTDPEIQTLGALADFMALNQYFVNSEGSVTRLGRSIYRASLTAFTQASDGMYLVRSPSFVSSRFGDLPTPERFVANSATVLTGLKKLRDAPVVDEEYRGPVIIEPDAANDVVTALIGKNILGHRPRLGVNARTTGEYASSYKSRILPEFLTLTDDPTQSSFNGHALAGSYEFDDEGVKAQPVKVVENGILTNYLLGRQPIRDFPNSNGHGRVTPGGSPSPALGNLILTGSQALSRADLKKKMIDLCRQQGKPYGYLLRTVISSNLYPLLLYRVYAQDGHEELVRGAVFKELDARALRNNLIAVGNDLEVGNSAERIPASVVSPSLLFDELEVKRSETGKEKLPDYPPPPLISPPK